MLATRACLRSGVGKVTALTPRCNYAIMQMSVPEAIVHPDSENYYSEAISTEEYNAVGIGPGLGRDEGSALALMSQLQQTQCPVVLDADALNMLGSHGMWISQLPDNMIMTPHPRELDRLAGTAPTPLRKHARVASTAAPAIPSLPAMSSALPIMPLWAKSSRCSIICLTRSASTVE